MPTCMARSGFLTLNDCGNPASSTCSTCARPMCVTHLSPLSGFTQCLDCYARADDATADPNYGPDWAWRSRHQYYRDSHYRPLYDGVAIGAYYDDYDVRSFDDSTNEGAAEDDDRTGGSFAQS